MVYGYEPEIAMPPEAVGEGVDCAPPQPAGISIVAPLTPGAAAQAVAVTSGDGTGEVWHPAGIDSTPAARLGAPAHAVAVTDGRGAALGQLTTNDGNVPTVQPFAPVGSGAAVPVPPLAMESGSEGPGESVAQIGTSTV